MEYFYENNKKEIIGPIDEDLLIDRARKGEITAQTLVRNTMVRVFKTADKIPCLQNIVKKETGAQANASFKDIAKNLHRSASSVKAPPINYRIMAFAFDLLLIGPAVILFYNALKMFAGKTLDPNTFAAIFFASFICIPVTYYTLLLGTKAQTFGYWFFGIMVIKGEGEEVYLGRAFFLAAIFIITLPLEIFLVFIFNKGLHEILTGTRIVNVRLG